MSIVKEIDSTELQNKLASSNDLYLLDIRSDAEVMHGMLPNSTHLPMHLLPLRAGEFPKDKEIVLYCRSGARSYHACMFLMQQGYSNVINLKGGIIDWARNGFSIVPYS
jgi:rhodanese-related sulfurtransferase